MENEILFHKTVVESVFLCQNTLFWNLYRLESAFPEALFSNVPERVWQLDVSEVLAVLECAVLDSL